MEPLGRPTSASSSVSLAGSDLLADPQAAKLGAANWATAGGNVYRCAFSGFSCIFTYLTDVVAYGMAMHSRMLHDRSNCRSFTGS